MLEKNKKKLEKTRKTQGNNYKNSLFLAEN